MIKSLPKFCPLPQMDSSSTALAENDRRAEGILLVMTSEMSTINLVLPNHFPKPISVSFSFTACSASTIFKTFHESQRRWQFL